MNPTKIELSKNIIIYKYKLDYNKESIISDVYTSVGISDRASIHQKNYPGIQSDFLVRNGEWDRLYNKISNILLTDIYKDTNITYTSRDWVFISNNLNTQIGFHHHLKMKDRNTTGEWTYTFYAQMPDILKGNDGKLLFKDDDDSIYSILPEEGDLLIFSAKHLHAVETNTSSNTERIVVAGTFCKLDVNKNKRKVKNTLM